MILNLLWVVAQQLLLLLLLLLWSFFHLFDLMKLLFLVLIVLWLEAWQEVLKTTLVSRLPYLFGIAQQDLAALLA